MVGVVGGLTLIQVLLALSLLDGGGLRDLDLVVLPSQLLGSGEVSLSSDSPGKVHVLLHDGGSLGVDGTQVGVLEDAYQVGLRCFLEGFECLAPEHGDLIGDGTEDLSDESLEGGSLDESVGGLLVSLDFSQGDCARSESVSPLHPSFCWGSLLLPGLGLLCLALSLGDHLCGNLLGE